METVARSQNGDVLPLLKAVASLCSSVYFVVLTCMHSIVDMYVRTYTHVSRNTHTHTVTGSMAEACMHVQVSLYILNWVPPRVVITFY